MAITPLQKAISQILEKLNELEWVEVIDKAWTQGTNRAIACYPQNGVQNPESAQFIIGYHNLILDIILPTGEAVDSMDERTGWIDEVPTLLIGAVTTMPNVSNIERISYEVGMIPVGNQPYYGVRFTLENVKVITQ
jgi:hypothetical protein